MKRTENINDIIRPLDEEPRQMYLTNALQVADVLEFILDYTGESKVKITSFSISEEFLRRLFFLRKKGNIKELEIILDFKATNKTLILWPFIAQTIENCYLADNHSKLMIVQSVKSKREAAVVMSQNLTRGNRLECGAITTDLQEIAQLDSQYEFIKKYRSVPFNDVYRGKIEAD